MRITALCSIFVGCFLYAEAASFKDMLPKLEGMKGIEETMKNIMKPLGCLDIIPGPEVSEPCKECMKKIVEDIKADNSKYKKIKLPSFKKTLEKLTQCKLEKMDFVVNGKYDIGRHDAFYESITYIKSNPDDLAVLNTAVNKCKTEVDFDAPAVNAALAFEKCIVGKTIDYCTEANGPQSVGVILPTIYALNSLFEDNKKCDSVRTDDESLDEYYECVEEKEDSSEEKKMPMGSNPFETAMAVLKGFKKLPEIECIIELSEEYGLMKNGETNFPNVADYVGKLEGWNDEDVKQEVIGKIEECGNVKADKAWQKDINFHACFLPKFADICGLDNELATEVMFPMLNAEFMSEILNRINDRFDLDSLLEMIPL